VRGLAAGTRRVRRAAVDRHDVKLCRLGPPGTAWDRRNVTWVRLFGRERPGGGTDRVACACRRHLIRRTGLTGPVRPGLAAAPAHVDVAATLLQPPRCHIDVVTRGRPRRTGRAACTTRTTGTTGTACSRTRPLTPEEPHPRHIVPVRVYRDQDQSGIP